MSASRSDKVASASCRASASLNFKPYRNPGRSIPYRAYSAQPYVAFRSRCCPVVRFSCTLEPDDPAIREV